MLEKFRRTTKRAQTGVETAPVFTSGMETLRFPFTVGLHKLEKTFYCGLLTIANVVVVVIFFILPGPEHRALPDLSGELPDSALLLSPLRLHEPVTALEWLIAAQLSLLGPEKAPGSTPSTIFVSLGLTLPYEFLFIDFKTPNSHSRAEILGRTDGQNRAQASRGVMS